MFCAESASFSLFIARFFIKVGRQQLKIKVPPFTFFHHLHHFAWVKSQAIPSKILIVIGQSSSRPSNRSFSRCFGKESLFGKSFLKHSAYMAKLSKLRSFNSKKERLDVKPHLHGRLFCVRFFDKNGCGKVASIQ